MFGFASALGEITSAQGTVNVTMAIVTLLSRWVANTFFLIGPVLMFVPQYKSIRESGSAKSFSTNVCFILLTAHLMRLFFWVGKRFETVLLLQSIIVVLSQLVLLHTCVQCNFNERIRCGNGGVSPSPNANFNRRERHMIEMTAVPVGVPRSPRPIETVPESHGVQSLLQDLLSQSFWNWDYFGTYLSFLFCYILVLSGASSCGCCCFLLLFCSPVTSCWLQA